MPDFLSYNPLTGVRRLFDMDEQHGIIYTRAEQDVEPILDRARALRNEKIYDNRKLEFRMVATLPAIVQLELRMNGLDIYSRDPAMIRRVLAEIEANYKRCKTTDKKL